MADMEIPPNDFYEDYPQLENGVGMMRLLMTEFYDELNKKPKLLSREPFSIATGESASPFLTNLLKTAEAKYDIITKGVFTVRNDFFGHSVTVSGLVTGGDLIKQLRGRRLGERLLISRAMLRSGEDVFLDQQR